MKPVTSGTFSSWVYAAAKMFLMRCCGMYCGLQLFMWITWINGIDIVNHVVPWQASQHFDKCQHSKCRIFNITVRCQFIRHLHLAKSTLIQFNGPAVKPNFVRLIMFSGQNFRYILQCSNSKMTIKLNQHLSDTLSTKSEHYEFHKKQVL